MFTQSNYPNKKLVYQLFGILRIDRNLIALYFATREFLIKKPPDFSSGFLKSGGQDSNLRPLGPKPSILPS